MFVYEVILFSYEGDNEDVWLDRQRLGIFKNLELAKKKANSIKLAKNQYWEIHSIEVDSEKESTLVECSTKP